MSVGNKAVSRLDLMTVYKAGPISKLQQPRPVSGEALVFCPWSVQTSTAPARLKTGPSSLVTEIKTWFCF